MRSPPEHLKRTAGDRKGVAGSDLGVRRKAFPLEESTFGAVGFWFRSTLRGRVAVQESCPPQAEDVQRRTLG
ncbi:hypothetical protein NDU88_006351 [Pleurodeles waltl]|uniref:Uncharacterized protein n=1 Tax=Pleurodeles waltl TaxID=8319 RepID=A0AAV7SP90_PLEWA|nr:hypothetical protein NDU88_006351 [Pleurodeles waltl]